MSKITRIKGFADLFSPDSDAFLFLEETARQVFSTYGYQEVRIPILEKTDLFCRSIGEQTDVVQKEMYTFPDRKGRSLTMRPEATAGVMRAYIENAVYSREQISRLFAIGPMFRYERPQKGRMRQFHQIDLECLGPEEPHCDAEVVLTCMRFLDKIGLTNLTLELNTLGCKDCRPVYNQALRDFLATLDTSSLCEDCVKRMETNPLRVLDCKQPGCKELTADAPSILGTACETCTSHFNTVREVLEAAGQAYMLNTRLVRGLDYYVRTTFEVVSGEIGAQSSVAGGGRYDGLIKDLGGPEIPGIGFALGMERLALLLAERTPRRMDFHIAVLDASGLTKGMQLAERLRTVGLTGTVAYAAKSAKSQLRAADKSGARFALLLGTKELEDETIQLKPLDGGAQDTIPHSEIINRLISCCTG